MEWDELDALDDVEAQEPPRACRKRPWLKALILSGFIVAGLVHLAQNANRQEMRPEPKDVPKAVLIAPAPTWKPLAQQASLFGIDKGATRWEARQHSDGRREDTLTLGAFGESGYARVVFAQNVRPERKRSLFVDLVHRAADAGLAVTRTAPSRSVKTKFGLLETAPVTLSTQSEQSCQGFRFSDDTTDFGFQGWFCGAEVQHPEDLACFIDRIELTGGGDISLKALFAKAETTRATCPPPSRTAAAGERF